MLTSLTWMEKHRYHKNKLENGRDGFKKNADPLRGDFGLVDSACLRIFYGCSRHSASCL